MPRATSRAISSTMSVVFPVPDQPVIATACISRVYADAGAELDALLRHPRVRRAKQYDPLHVIAGLGKRNRFEGLGHPFVRRGAAPLRHVSLPRVVRGDRQSHFAREEIDEVLEIDRTDLDVRD